jgi:hypothetical protein
MSVSNVLLKILVIKLNANSATISMICASGISCGSHWLEVGVTDVAPRLGNFVSELRCRVGLGIGRVPLAIKIHVLLGQAGEFTADISMG